MFFTQNIVILVVVITKLVIKHYLSLKDYFFLYLYLISMYI